MGFKTHSGKHFDDVNTLVWQLGTPSTPKENERETGTKTSFPTHVTTAIS